MRRVRACVAGAAARRERGAECCRSRVSRGRAGLLDRVAARRRQPSAVPHRVVVPHRLARNARAASRSAFRSRSFAIGPASTKTIRRVSSRGKCCSRTQRSAIRRRGALLRGEKSARAGFGLAEAGGRLARMCKIDDWSLRKEGERIPRRRRRRASSRCELECIGTQPPLLQGKNGFSQKSPQPQFASYYYSLPQLQTSGRIAIGGREHRVRGCRVVRPRMVERACSTRRARGWDWIGLNLDDGGALMVQRIRDDAGERALGRRDAARAGQPRDRCLRAGRDRVVAAASLALAAHGRHAIRSNGKSRSASAR